MNKKELFTDWLRNNYGKPLLLTEIADKAQEIFEGKSYSAKISIGSIDDTDFYPHGDDITKEELVKMTGARKQVYDIMSDGEWRTVEQIQHFMTEFSPPQSVTIYLRSFREAKYGGYVVNKRKVGKSRLFEYQVLYR